MIQLGTSQKDSKFIPNMLFAALNFMCLNLFYITLCIYCLFRKKLHVLEATVPARVSPFSWLTEMLEKDNVLTPKP